MLKQADVSQHGVDHREKNGGDHSGTDGGAQNRLFPGDAQGLDVQHDHDAEVQPCNGVHSLVTGQKSFHGGDMVVGR